MADNRPTAVAQRKLAEMINNSPRVLQQRALSDAIHNSPRMVARRHEMNSLFGGTVNPQRDGAIPAEASPAQHEEKTNNTGLPNQLKSGIESLSGLDMSGVRVHRNSDKPAQLNALAYAQGADIHLGPGQEQHLPHEAWHVVQQAQGRVRETGQRVGGEINDEVGLEREADLMGGRAMQFMANDGKRQDLPQSLSARSSMAEGPVQRVLNVRGGTPPTAADFARLHTLLKGEALVDGGQNFQFVSYGQAPRTIVVQNTADQTYWLCNLDSDLRTALDAHGLPIPAPKKKVETEPVPKSLAPAASTKVEDTDSSDDEDALLTASTSDAAPSAEVLGELKTIKLPIQQRPSRHEVRLPLQVSVSDMVDAVAKDSKVVERSTYALAVLEAYRAEREKKGKADPARLAALQWALSEIQFPSSKSSGGFGGRLGTLKVVRHESSNLMEITGRPAFEPAAAALEGMQKGFHRRHIIAWHTIKRSVQNLSNLVLSLSKDEGEKALHGAFLRLLVAIEAGEKAATAKTEEEVVDEAKNSGGQDAAETVAMDTTSAPTVVVAPAKKGKTKKPPPDRATFEGALTLLLQKLNSNLHNLWPGEGYENSLINSYQYIIREWAKEVLGEPDPGKWAKALGKELNARVTEAKKKPPATFKRVVGGFAEQLVDWTPKEGGKPTPAQQLSKFLEEGADTFEVDYPYSPNRKTFRVKHEVAANMLRVASILLPWSENQIAGGVDQSVAGLVTYLEAALNTFMFPPGEGETTATTPVVSLASKTSAPMPVDAGGKEQKGAPKSASKDAIAVAAPLFVRVPYRDWAGVPNAGNTCYIASVLNLILANRYYLEEIKGLRWVRGRTPKQWHLAAATESMLAALEGHKLDVHDVDRYRQALIASGWLGGDYTQAGRQQDAAELLQFILGNTTDAIGVKVQHTYRDRGAMVANRPEASPEPILPVLGLHYGGDNVRTIEALLGANFDGTPKAEVSGGTIRDHTYKLASLPPVLTIQLARFNFGSELGRAFKLHEKVTAGHELIIPAAISPSGDDVRYQLTAFVLHIGETPGGGHYVTYRREGRMWVLADDSKGQLVRDEEVAAKIKDAYIITYQHAS